MYDKGMESYGHSEVMYISLARSLTNDKAAVQAMCRSACRQSSADKFVATGDLIFLRYVGGVMKHVGGFSNYARPGHPWDGTATQRRLDYMFDTRVSFSSTGHCHRSRQLSASGDVILPHKAGERVCLVSYEVADRDGGADFFVDVSRIATLQGKPCGMNPCCCNTSVRVGKVRPHAKPSS